MSHSPGPWKWSDDTVAFEPLVLRDANGKRVCHFGDATVKWEEMAGEPPGEADARLIAAAPELLARLKHSADCDSGAAYCKECDEGRSLVKRIEGGG